MLEPGYCLTEEVNGLWEQKSRMDSLFDSGKGDLYYTVRDQEFPQDKKGSNRFSNRAGDKLWEVHESVNIFEGIKQVHFLDVCGGPGAFSNLLLSEAPKPCIGWGMTLKASSSKRGESWYHDLETNVRFKIVYGQDNTGDVYNPLNIDFLVNAISKSNRSRFDTIDPETNLIHLNKKKRN